MSQAIIRPAHTSEYDQIARVWMDSWVSTGLEDASDSLLEKLRARVPMEVEKGWSWYEREGFVFEKEQIEPMMGRMMKYYRWRKSA